MDDDCTEKLHDSVEFCTEEPWCLGKWEDARDQPPWPIGKELPLNRPFERAVNAIRKKGNEAFVSKDYNKAVELYCDAIDLSDSQRVKSPIPGIPYQYPIQEVSRRAIYSNRAACYLAQGKYQACLDDCDECLTGVFPIPMAPPLRKAAYRRAQALWYMGKIEDALAACDAVYLNEFAALPESERPPGDESFLKLKQTIEASIEDEEEEESSSKAKVIKKKGKKKASRKA
ncbi:uncharacterized protein MELLADRAFT_63178 [Melampsora larici-populina 98AG31]|uniref:Uncharacterized protein n=1 Tax=Melampsora larici-populina (strain 98AG31 / pathotype 3-4-7) TaxID=747676 RepID=F4RLQ2_MELLP|nr:uncharacterized protein MELLADRAFT_63178 [Melampsora larici-populina 98AG31]EGG06575.1 hypothetical protein MELLADRAFT_63178 [Melampsora larici-populina 98AG31]